MTLGAAACRHCGHVGKSSSVCEANRERLVKHALITGGAGFIGSHLAEALIARDYRVTVVDDESTGTAENLAAVRDHFNFSFVHGTVADKALVRQLVGDVDEVYHLAAAVGVQLISTAPIHTIETNIYPTELILNELLRRKRDGYAVKLFLASSSEVYGKNPKPLWTEDDDLVFGPTTRPRWSYGASKAIDEFLALAYWRQHRLPVVIGRFFNVVGPRQTGRYGMVLPRFVEAALAGRPLVVHDDGHQVRCFAHVNDVVRSVIELMETDAAVAGVFNIGSDQPVSILQLAKSVIAAVNPQARNRLSELCRGLRPGFRGRPLADPRPVAPAAHDPLPPRVRPGSHDPRRHRADPSPPKTLVATHVPNRTAKSSNTSGATACLSSSAFLCIGKNGGNRSNTRGSGYRRPAGLEWYLLAHPGVFGPGDAEPGRQGSNLPSGHCTS